MVAINVSADLSFAHPSPLESLPRRRDQSGFMSRVMILHNLKSAHFRVLHAQVRRGLGYAVLAAFIE